MLREAVLVTVTLFAAKLANVARVRARELALRDVLHTRETFR